jgi:hypothetical protein
MSRCKTIAMLDVQSKVRARNLTIEMRNGVTARTLSCPENWQFFFIPESFGYRSRLNETRSLTEAAAKLDAKRRARPTNGKRES